MTKKTAVKGPEIVREKLFALQVCVPKRWTKKQIEDFANLQRPFSRKWKIRPKAESKGDPIRATCHDRSGYVHVVLVY